MADKSAIEWTDASWNPVTGCTKVSPGCAHCYAETFATRGLGRFAGRRPFEDVQCHDQALTIPLHWKRPRRIFVNSMSDLFHEDVPDAFLHAVYHTMEAAHWHTFQILTKRAERMRAYLDWRYGPDEETPRGRIPSRHIWHGVSVENQHFADERIRQLLLTKTAVRFISAEPLLGPIAIRHYLISGRNPAHCANCGRGHGFSRCPNYGSIARTDSRQPRCESFKRQNFDIDWVIVGGESGSGARPFDLAWARSILQQCQAAGVACFMKQLGAKPMNGWEDQTPAFRAYHTAPAYKQCRFPIFLESRKGGDPSEWPEDLRVREFPKVEAR